MPQNNKISVVMSAEESAATISKIEELNSSLESVLTISLTAKERSSMLKMGDKTLAFVQKALEYAEQNKTLIPAFLDLPEAHKDYELAVRLYAIQQKLSALLRAVEDSSMLAGSEAYDAALIFYASVKAASRANVPGVQAIHNDLKERFPRRKKEELLG